MVSIILHVKNQVCFVAIQEEMVVFGREKGPVFLQRSERGECIEHLLKRSAIDLRLAYHSPIFTARRI